MFEVASGDRNHLVTKPLLVRANSLARPEGLEP